MQDYIRNNVQATARKHDLWIGIDTDKASLAVTVKDSDKAVKSLKMPYDTENLFSFLERHYPGRNMVFAYEAGPTGFGLYDSIMKRGYQCLVVSPSSIPKAPNDRVKTNRLDSKKLAELLSGGQLKTFEFLRSQSGSCVLLCIYGTHTCKTEKRISVG
jgi:transposase